MDKKEATRLYGKLGDGFATIKTTDGEEIGKFKEGFVYPEEALIQPDEKLLASLDTKPDTFYDADSLQLLCAAVNFAAGGM